MHTNTQLIQDSLQLPVVEIEDTYEGMEEMCEYRNTEIQHIEEDAHRIKEMFQDLAELVDGQQPAINNVAKTLRSAEHHVEKAEEKLVEVEQGKKCLIS